MNIELVYIILLGINNFMDQINNQSNQKMTDLKIVKNKEGTKITL